MQSVQDYQNAPAGSADTTPELHTIGQRLLEEKLVAVRRGKKFNIGPELATEIWDHIQQLPAVAVQQIQPWLGPATAASTPTVGEVLQISTHVPAAGDPCWQSSNTPSAMQTFFQPPSKGFELRSDDKSLLSRDFDSAQTRAPVPRHGTKRLVMRLHKKPPAGWMLALFMACLLPPQFTPPPTQQQHHHHHHHQQQQQQQEEEEDEGDAALIDEDGFQRRFRERTGNNPEIWNSSAAPATAAPPTTTTASAVISGASVTMQPPAPNNHATSLVVGTSTASNSPMAVSFNPSHSNELIKANHNRTTLLADVSVGWLVMMRESSAVTNPPRKRRATGLAEPISPRTAATISAEAAAAAAAADAAAAQLEEEMRLMSFDRFIPPDWDTAKQLQLFDPERVWSTQQGGGSGPDKPQLPTDDDGIEQLQRCILYEHEAGRGKNSKGQNVLHLLAMTKRADMETRKKLFIILSTAPVRLGQQSLLESLLEDTSNDGSYPLMLAAWGDPRPQVSGTKEDGQFGYRCQRWRPDIYIELLQYMPRKLLYARDKQGWTVLHRLLHSAAIYNQHEDYETRDFVLNAYADTLFYSLSVAVRALAAAPAALAAAHAQQHQTASRHALTCLVELSSTHHQQAQKYVRAMRDAPDPPNCSKYIGHTQKAAAEQAYAGKYPDCSLDRL